MNHRVHDRYCLPCPFVMYCYDCYSTQTRFYLSLNNFHFPLNGPRAYITLVGRLTFVSPLLFHFSNCFSSPDKYFFIFRCRQPRDFYHLEGTGARDVVSSKLVANLGESFETAYSGSCESTSTNFQTYIFVIL